MKIRALLNILLGISIVFFPWQISLILGLLLLGLYPAYEVLFWSFFFDTLYGTAYLAFYNIQFLGTTVFFILLLISFVVKRKIIFY